VLVTASAIATTSTAMPANRPGLSRTRQALG
jgi:hypothetical protein